MAEEKLPQSVAERRVMIEADHPEINVRRQCELLELNRSSYYYAPAQESAENLELMRLRRGERRRDVSTPLSCRLRSALAGLLQRH